MIDLTTYNIYFPKDHYTKTYKYLYLPSTDIIHSYSERILIKEMQDEYFNVYIGDEGCADYKKFEPVLYITVNHNHPDFSKLMDLLKTKNVFYIDSYMYDTNRTVFRLKYPSKQIFDLFLEGKYSKMYVKDAVPNDYFKYEILDKDYLIKQYLNVDPFNKKQGEVKKIDYAYYVLTHGVEYVNFICKEFDIQEKSVIENIAQKEFDGLIDMQKEVLINN